MEQKRCLRAHPTMESQRFDSGKQLVLICLCSQALLCHFPPHVLYLENSDRPLQSRQVNHTLSTGGSNVTGKSLEFEVTRLRAEAFL